MLDLTVLIITKNEEDNLPKCIASLQGLASRIVVVDSFSTDRTVEVAQYLGAEVYKNPFVDHATQINWGLAQTNITTEWIMRLDADEELTAELADEIKQRLPGLGAEINGVELKRRVYFMNRWIKHGGVYPTVLLRIFRRNTAYCEQTLMDEHFLLKSGKTVLFKKDLIDHNTKSLEWWINKHNWYSNKEVQDHIEKQKQLEDGVTIRPRFWGGGQAERKRWLKYMVYYRTPLMRRAHWYFIYRYIIRLGFLDGKEGLAFHFLQGYWYRFLVDAKIHEHRVMGTETQGRGDLK